MLPILTNRTVPITSHLQEDLSLGRLQTSIDLMVTSSYQKNSLSFSQPSSRSQSSGAQHAGDRLELLEHRIPLCSSQNVSKTDSQDFRLQRKPLVPWMAEAPWFTTIEELSTEHLLQLLDVPSRAKRLGYTFNNSCRWTIWTESIQLCTSNDIGPQAAAFLHDSYRNSTINQYESHWGVFKSWLRNYLKSVSNIFCIFNNRKVAPCTLMSCKTTLKDPLLLGFNLNLDKKVCISSSYWHLKKLRFFFFIYFIFFFWCT